MRLVADKLKKTYNKREVVKDVSFEVCEREIVGLLGTNGAGKSTSFYMTVGLIKPESGNVFLDDKDITLYPLYKRAKLGISYLPQESSVFKKLSVEDNIMVALESMSLKKSEKEEKLEELLEQMHITHIKKSKGYMLSGGERRRVEICRLLALKPRFIFLDEPFAGVDPISVYDIQEIIRYLKGQNIGVFITDHNVRETLGITDRAYIMISGTILCKGTPEEIVEDPIARKAYLGEQFKL